MVGMCLNPFLPEHPLPVLSQPVPPPCCSGLGGRHGAPALPHMAGVCCACRTSRGYHEWHCLIYVSKQVTMSYSLPSSEAAPLEHTYLTT